MEFTTLINQLICINHINHQTPHYKTWGFGGIELLIMGAKLKYWGKVNDNDILKLYQSFEGDLSVFRGQEVELTIELKNKRSLNQNGFYWSNFVPAQIEAFKERWGESYRSAQVHDWNKANFWGEEKIVEATGECVMTPASSTAQSTVEWEIKLEKIRQWFRQNFEWELPYPLQQNEINY